VSTTRRQKQRAHRYLYEVYRETIDRLTGDVLAKGEDLAGLPFDYGWEDLQDRYAMRVQHLQVLLGALEGASRPAVRTRRWVKTLLTSTEDLESALNAELGKDVEDGGEVEDVSVLPAPDDQVCVVLRYRACVPVRERAAAG
jgi:hypothetical protein